MRVPQKVLVENDLHELLPFIGDIVDGYCHALNPKPLGPILWSTQIQLHNVDILTGYRQWSATSAKTSRKVCLDSKLLNKQNSTKD